MKAVILAGGFGTRLQEETVACPKPMVEIGGMPILWHIMKTYSFCGINDFIILCGYKGNVIKDYFCKYVSYLSDITIDFHRDFVEVHRKSIESWRVTLVDTGEKTMTGGRLKQAARYVEEEDAFCFTYGDGLSDVDLTALIAHHQKSGLLATLTAVKPPGRFGVLDLEGNRVVRFQEKPSGDGCWINGGFFVLSPKVINRIKGDHTVWEGEPLETLAKDGQLSAYKHFGFWHPMDTLRDKHHLETLWETGKAPWRVW